MAAETSQHEKSRRSATDILLLVKETAREELGRPTLKLAYSGMAGGLVMGLTPLGVAALGAYVANKPTALVLYPLGFIAVIIGRMHLFTENTLHPVVFVLSERDRLFDAARLWTTVWISNVIGTLVFGLLAIRTGGLHGEFTDQISRFGTEAVQGSFAQLFWGAVIAGWLVALAAWLTSASHWTIGQIAAIWLLTFPIGLLKIPHSIAGSAEILSAVVAGSVSVGQYAYWMSAATLGNAAGGVLIVAVLNWAQASNNDAGAS